MSQIYYTLLSITLLYFVFALLFRELIKKVSGRPVCSICAAVSLTWFGSLVLKFLGYQVDNLIIGILMGGSVVGLMYQAENYFKKNNWSFWFIRLVIIIGGFASTYFLIEEKFFSFFLSLALAAVLIIIAWFISAGGRRLSQVETSNPAVLEELKDKLDHCCD